MKLTKQEKKLIKKRRKFNKELSQVEQIIIDQYRKIKKNVDEFLTLLQLAATLFYPEVENLFLCTNENSIEKYEILKFKLDKLGMDTQHFLLERLEDIGVIHGN